MTDGWIEWKGGECPIEPETIVETHYRNGDCDDARPAHRFGWDHWGGDEMGAWDIIAYRVIDPTTPSVDRGPVSVEPMTDEHLRRVRLLVEMRLEEGRPDQRLSLSAGPFARLLRRLDAAESRALPAPRRYTGGPLEDGLYLWRRPGWTPGIWKSVEARGAQFVPEMMSWGPSEMAASGDPFWLIGPIPIPGLPEEEAANG